MVRQNITIPHPNLARLLVTGQTTQYSSKEDDGYYEKGVPKDYTALDSGQYSGTTNITLNAKTHALSNECVQDNRTGLMWARYVPTADIGPDADGKLYWVDDTNDEDIFDFCDQANSQELGGHDDWRVPNWNEEQSLLGFEGAAGPYIDGTAFPSAPSDLYWTSTTAPLATTKALAVNLYNALQGNSTKTTSKHYCRLVRG